MFITVFTCPTENEYLAPPQFACCNAEGMFSQTSTLHLVMFLSDIPIDFAFGVTADLVEWVEYF